MRRRAGEPVELSVGLAGFLRGGPPLDRLFSRRLSRGRAPWRRIQPPPRQRRAQPRSAPFSSCRVGAARRRSTGRLDGGAACPGRAGSSRRTGGVPRWRLGSSLRAELQRVPGTIIVAHSLGCTLVAHLAALQPELRLGGALLVAPPDLDVAQRTPVALRPLGPSPRARAPCRTLLVASRSDPYASFAHAEVLAERWGADLVDLGARGHVNVVAGVGGWREGLPLLRRLSAAVGPRGTWGGADHVGIDFLAHSSRSPRAPGRLSPT